MSKYFFSLGYSIVCIMLQLIPRLWGYWSPLDLGLIAKLITWWMENQHILLHCSMQVWHNFISIFTWSFFSYHLSLKVLILHTKVLLCSLMLQHLSFSSKISCNIENCTEYFRKETKSCPPINNQKLTHVPPNFW